MKSLLQQSKQKIMLHFYNSSKKSKIFLLIMCFLSLKVIEGEAQSSTWKYKTPTRDSVIIKISQPDGICGNPEVYVVKALQGGTLLEASKSNPAKRFKAKAGMPITVEFEFKGAKNIYNAKGDFYYNFLDVNGPQTIQWYTASESEPTNQEKSVSFDFNNDKSIQKVKFTVTFNKSASLGYLYTNTGINQTHSNGQGPTGESLRLYIPFIITGQIEEKISVLGKAIQPMVPYMILHAPPGDGSSSETAETKTSCREFSTTLETESVHNADVAVKIGIAGSAGLFVTTDFEFSVTFSAKLTAGDLAIKSNANQTCVTMTKGFSTGAMIGLKGSGDVFMGYGTDLDYGIYRMIRQDAKTCLTSLDSGLVYAPSSNARTFFMTEEQLLDDIAYQRSVSARTDTTVKARNLAANQADVWEKILAMNKANKDNPSNSLIKNITFGKGVTITEESGITVVNTNTLDVQNYLEASVGISALVEVAGSGVSGGYEYTNKHRYGNTTTNSQETQKMVKYTLTDDDAGDKFDVKIVRDPMFGTPVFRLESSTKSSCPYQGGYQRDQPKLKHDGTTNDHITSTKNPIGSSVTFKLDICNESNEARNYNLKLNATSNLNGAVVSASGVPLNGNDLGQTYMVPANSCLQDLIVEVKQLSANSPLSYPNLELFLYSECEPDIQSSVFASIYFGNATAVENETNNDLLKVYPNPSSGKLNISFGSDKNIEFINIMDMSGKTILYAPIIDSKSIHEIDLSGQAKGVYVLQVQSNGKRQTKKLILE